MIMYTINRIEILLPEALVQPCTAILDQAAILAYTVSVGLSGKNPQGMATPGLCDAAIIILCQNAAAAPLLAKLTPFLKRFGGIGTMTEVASLTPD
jgi:hypothetical protein